jgi:hypothetical protein
MLQRQCAARTFDVLLMRMHALDTYNRQLVLQHATIWRTPYHHRFPGELGSRMCYRRSPYSA